MIRLKFSVFKMKRYAGFILYKCVNLFLALVGYRLLDARYDYSKRIILNGEDISHSTKRALVCRKAGMRKTDGWAIRMLCKDGNFVRGDNNQVVMYRDYGVISWMP